MAEQQHNDVPPSTNTPPELPPPPSVLLESMEGEWTEDNWKTALEAANALPDEKRRKLLRTFHTDKEQPFFMEMYKLAYAEWLKTSPEKAFRTISDYLEYRIAQAPNSSPITVWWRRTKGENQQEKNSERANATPGLQNAESAAEVELVKCRFFATKTSTSTYNKRIINIEEITSIQRAMKLLEAIVAPFGPVRTVVEPRALSSKILYVLSGESGSGKTTWALMVCDYGIYLTAGDLRALHLDLIEKLWGEKEIDDKLTITIAEHNLVEAALKAVLTTTDETTKDVLVQQHLEALDNQPYTFTDGVVARAVRNHLVVAALTQVIQFVVGHDRTTRPKGLPTESFAISLVLDEFGSYPAFVRGLCAAQMEVRSAIKAMFPFDAEVKIIVVGTGTDVQPDFIGSHPSTYNALRMPSDRPMKDMIKDVLDARFRTMAKTLVSALDSHVQAQHLICNPRFAACLLKRLVNHCKPLADAESKLDALFATEEQALTCLDLQLTASAIMYKSLNGMIDCSAEDVKRIYHRALQLMLRIPEDEQKPDPEDFDLLRKKGVLTDNGMWVEPCDLHKYVTPNSAAATHDTAKELQGAIATHVAVRSGIFAVEDKKSKFVFVVPRTGRYAMSMAQQLLFRMNYGYHVLETAASWQHYEVVVADYMSMLLYGMQGQKLRGLLQRFEEEATVVTSAKAKAAKEKTAPSANEEPAPSPNKEPAPSDDEEPAPSDNEEPAPSANEVPAASTEIKDPLQKPLSYSRVVTIHTKKRISPKIAAATVNKVYNDCKIAPKEKTAAVIVNGAGAPYADVIVVVPGVAVILIQCKFYGKSSTIDVPEEAKKLEAEIGALNAIADVPNGAYFRVLATTKDLVPANLHGFYLLNTSSATSLAPLFTPLHQPVAANGKDSKITRSMGVPEKRQRDGD